MSVLCDMSIRALPSETIVPFSESQVQPASYDVQLAGTFRVFDTVQFGEIDPLADDDYTRLFSTEEAIRLHPGQFVLGRTLEYFKIPVDIAARLEGKSSLGRLGLVIHSTAGWFDPGFEGTGTLELTNIANLPIVLRPGMLIGQMAFFKMDHPSMFPYGSPELNSQYQGQTDPEASRMWRKTGLDTFKR